MVERGGYYRKDFCIRDLEDYFLGDGNFIAVVSYWLKILVSTLSYNFSVLASVSTLKTIFLTLLVVAIRL